MQSNAPVGQHNDQQQQPPALPSYAEAMRTATAPNFSHSYTIDHDSFHPNAAVYGPQVVPVHEQFSTQPNYTHVPLPPTGYPYPPTYATNAYPQYGQPTANLETPTTIHIIRPVSTTTTTCCRGTSGRLLGIVLGLIILGAILRATVHSYS